MKIDFFDKKHNPITISEQIFYLADKDGKLPAYVNLKKCNYSVAKIDNKTRKSITFTAIDKNIEIPESEGRRCDCMITFESNIYFVELKNQMGSWKTDSYEQLQNTIRIFAENHRIDTFKRKRAYACNAQHPKFQQFTHEEISKFKKENHGFIPFAEATITI